jgi:hypothetical protein
LNTLSNLGKLLFQCFQLGLQPIELLCRLGRVSGELFQVLAKLDVDVVLLFDNGR